MAKLDSFEQRQEIASKVLRRAQVSKMTRALQDRLALANIKIKHGWQNLSIDSIEPEIEKELKRKRSYSTADVGSDSSSTASGRCFSIGIPSSSPLTAPVYSDDVGCSGGSRDSAKRLKITQPLQCPPTSSQDPSRPRRTRPPARTWKSDYALPQSSPIVKPSHNPSHSTSEIRFTSFASETSTILDSSSVSEDDDADLPLHSFQATLDEIPSSPPRTPPPGVARSARLRSKPFTSSPPTGSSSSMAGREGADLLLYLAASPSPAMRVSKSSAEMEPPSTPPSKHTPLPSSMMGTPGGQNFLGFGLTTPGPAFNFADYVNVTPSPAQAAWASKTPNAAKTPRAAREARRRLNFDGVVVSPNIGSMRSSGRKGAGLGMELGGELVS